MLINAGGGPPHFGSHGEEDFIVQFLASIA
jgi:hypothetical protein